MARAVVPRAAVITLLLVCPVDAPVDAMSPGAPSEVRGTALATAAHEGRRSPPEPRFVRDAQKALRHLGYDPGRIDGVVGSRTQAALVRYQRAEGLPPRGQLDVETMARLDIHERVLRVTGEVRSDVQPAPVARRLAAPPRP